MEEYWVIDFLPVLVPADGVGQYFAVEEYLRSSEEGKEIYERFVRLLLKLNCYDDLCVTSGEDDEPVINPEPAQLADLVCACRKPGYGLCMRTGSAAVITLNSEDLYMTLYEPDDDLLRLMGMLCASEGLFLRKMPAETDETKNGV